MENCNVIEKKVFESLSYDLGTFEGFNFRHQSAISRNLTAEEVVNWDHDREGEAEFWPSGDNDGVALVFSGKSAVTGNELLALDSLLGELRGDSVENFLKIHYVVNTQGTSFEDLTRDDIEDLFLDLFLGTSFIDLRKEAAYQLFEANYPEEYRIWEKSHCDGLVFDVDHFLDSPCWSVEEIKLGDQKALIVVPQ
jgi:hypothetical protein